VNIETAFDLPCWYAVRTNPGQEERAHCNLLACGVETFHPKMRDRRRNKITGVQTFVTKPLFPRYIFARFTANKLLHKISYTRGVHSVVSFGYGPTPVDDEIIAVIREQVGPDGFVRVGEELRPGDRVQLTDGPMRDLTGVFAYGADDSDRVQILLTTVSFQGHVTVEREFVEKVA
jgi:transcriptional antiterminator RfaH